MNKKVKKILFVLVLTILIITIHNTISNAASNGISFSWNAIKGQADKFIGAGREEGSGYINSNNLADLVGGLGTILTTIGGVVVLVGFLVIGIQYMMATPEEAAKLKTKLVGLTVAGIVILGAWGIWNLTLTFLSGITG